MSCACVGVRRLAVLPALVLQRSSLLCLMTNNCSVGKEVRKLKPLVKKPTAFLFSPGVNDFQSANAAKIG